MVIIDVCTLTHDEYEEIDDPTLEDSHRKELVVDDDKVTLDVLDTGGSEEHHYLHDKWLGWADGVVFVYDCHSAYSFDMIPRYRDEMAKVKGTKEFPVVLVANQTEGEEAGWEITSKEGRSIAYTYRCPFVEASAKTGLGVDSIFSNIVKEIKDKRKAAAFDAISAPNKKKAKSGSAIQRVVMTEPKKMGVMQTKATVKPFKSAKKAWVAIKDGVVYLYAKEKDIEEGVPAVALNLLTCTVKPKYGEKKLKNCFELISLKSQFQFVADSPNEMMDWINAIQEGIAHMLNENTADKSKLKGQEDRGNLQTWEELKKQTENRACVDCGAADPDWISINLGLLMCIQCSGVHRSMGVHISKVRSITLDELEAEVQDLMKSIGNRMVNSLWERGLAQSAKRKPSPTDDRPTKEKFIRAKYADREFVVKEDIDANSLGRRLYEAAACNDLEDILACVSQGVEPNWRNADDHGRTALHAAAAAGHGLACLMLILNSVEPNAVDDESNTALALCPSASCAEVLKRNGATGEALRAKPDEAAPPHAPSPGSPAPSPAAADSSPLRSASFSSLSSSSSSSSPPLSSSTATTPSSLPATSSLSAPSSPSPSPALALRGNTTAHHPVPSPIPRHGSADGALAPGAELPTSSPAPLVRPAWPPRPPMGGGAPPPPFQRSATTGLASPSTPPRTPPPAIPLRASASPLLSSSTSSSSSSASSSSPSSSSPSPARPPARPPRTLPPSH